MHYTKCGVKS